MFRICKIIVESQEESNKLKKYFSGYPVEITLVNPEDDYYEVPTMMIGWHSVKNKFPNQKINSNNVIHNLFWTYSEVELSEVIGGNNLYKTLEDFVNENLFNWLPSDYHLYDSIFDGEFSKFIDNNILKTELSYIHFYSGAMYIRNNNKNFIINVKNLFLTESSYRNTITEFLNELSCMVYTYNKIEEYVNLDELDDLRALDTLRWIKFGIETPIKYFQIIPNADVNKYIPFLMSKIPLASLELNIEEEIFFQRMCVREKATRWMSTRYISLSYDFQKNLDYLYRDSAKLAKINYSNKRTLTGRIVSHDRYNPQNLEKEGKDRSMIISRFNGGKVYQFDYTSFEARIALYLCEDDDFIQNYYDKDLHAETARIIFEIYDINEEQRFFAKTINMSIIYGASEATVLKKLEVFYNPSEKLIEVKRFLYPLFKKSKEFVEIAEEKGYLINQWGSIIKPEKIFAGFNNYIQSTASEIIVDKTLEIKKLLQNRKSQFMFQGHDSFVFDIHPQDEDIVKDIITILSYSRGMLFSIAYKYGDNYKDLSSEIIIF